MNKNIKRIICITVVLAIVICCVGYSQTNKLKAYEFKSKEIVKTFHGKKVVNVKMKIPKPYVFLEHTLGSWESLHPDEIVDSGKRFYEYCVGDLDVPDNEKVIIYYEDGSKEVFKHKRNPKTGKIHYYNKKWQKLPSDKHRNTFGEDDDYQREHPWHVGKKNKYCMKSIFGINVYLPVIILKEKKYIKTVKTDILRIDEKSKSDNIVSLRILGKPNINAFQVKVYSSKKMAKKMKKPLAVKKTSKFEYMYKDKHDIEIKSKKLRGKNHLYLRARSIMHRKGKKYYSPWSKVKKVKIKK